MSDETMSWLDELFSTCKRFGVDYYNASEKDRVFVEAVARKNYGLNRHLPTEKPLLPWSRSLGFTERYKVSGSAAVENAPPHPQTIRSGDFFVVDGTGREQGGA